MKAELLGSAQDGGVPHLGCGCPNCTAAREDVSLQRSAASLKVSDEEKGVNYLFDVSPDIRHQLGDAYIDGIFVTHAHLGHVTGLLYLGTEGYDADNVPVHCSETVQAFLEQHPSYRKLLDRDNVAVDAFTADELVQVMGITVQPIPVQNKGYVETDTHAFLIDGPERTLCYMPDVDEWTDSARKAIAAADVALVDGTFWSTEEIDRFEMVPHPPIKESMDVFGGMDTELYFTHMNHTNPVLDADSDARQELEDRGFGVAEDGMTLEL